MPTPVPRRRDSYLSLATPALLLAALGAPGLPAQEWTRFRGPNGTGVSATTGVPVAWTEAEFRWRVRVPGTSHAQPVIWGDRIFVPTSTDQGRERTLLCLQREDGNELWRRTYDLPTGTRPNKRASFANESAVVDARRVVALFVSSEHFWVRAFDHDGRELWARDLGPFQSRHGHASSPRISYVPTPLHHDGRIYMVNDAGVASALEAATGRVLWAERLAVGEFYSSPVLVEGRLYCASAAGEMFVLAAGDTFRLLARNPLGEGTHSTPCLDRGRLYVKTFTHLVCIGGK